MGIDVGLTSFATLHTGEKVENPRFFRRAADSIARAQRALSSKPKPPEGPTGEQVAHQGA